MTPVRCWQVSGARAQAEAGAVLVTRSAKGLTLVRRDARRCICPRGRRRWPTCPAPATR